MNHVWISLVVPYLIIVGRHCVPTCSIKKRKKERGISLYIHLCPCTLQHDRQLRLNYLPHKLSSCPHYILLIIRAGQDGLFCSWFFSPLPGWNDNKETASTVKAIPPWLSLNSTSNSTFFKKGRNRHFAISHWAVGLLSWLSGHQKDCPGSSAWHVQITSPKSAIINICPTTAM